MKFVYVYVTIHIKNELHFTILLHSLRFYLFFIFFIMKLL